MNPRRIGVNRSKRKKENVTSKFQLGKCIRGLRRTTIEESLNEVVEERKNMTDREWKHTEI